MSPKPADVGSYWHDAASPFLIPGLNDRESSVYGYIDERTTGIPSVVNIKDPAYGAIGDGSHDDTAAIQGALDALGLSGVSGGVVFVPHTGANYRITAALTTYPHVRLRGEQTRQSGASLIKADAAGTYTNGPIAAKYMIKQQGASSAGSYWHGGGLEYIAFDCNSVAGLGGAHMWQPGENCLIDVVRVDNAGVTARTVTDMVTNATTTITSATAAFTADDVNAIVTGTNIPASTKIDRVNSATSATLNNAATGSGSGGSLTVNRPADAVVFDGGAPTGLIRSLNGINNKGALLRLTNQSVGSWLVESLSGDSNGGGLLRVSLGSAGADPMSITVVNIKAENPGAVTAMDPVILLDNCDMVALNLIGGSAVNSFSGRDVVRIDQPVTTRGGPSVHLTGIEGINPFNTGYTNIIRDTSTGQAVAANANNVHIYPDILWGRSLIMGAGNGGASIVTPKATPAYGTTVTPDALAGTWQTITVTNATAFTVAAPTNPPTANQSAELLIEVLNSSGGAMGVITWNAAFVFSVGAWVNPANTKKRFARFEWNGTNWICTSLATADY